MFDIETERAILTQGLNFNGVKYDAVAIVLAVLSFCSNVTGYQGITVL